MYIFSYNGYRYILEDIDKLCNITCICYVCARFNQGSTQPRRSNSIAIHSL